MKPGYYKFNLVSGRLQEALARLDYYKFELMRLAHG